MTIRATTYVVRQYGKLFISVSTLEELVTSMRRDSVSKWQVEIETIQQIIDNAREAERRLL